MIGFNGGGSKIKHPSCERERKVTDVCRRAKVASRKLQGCKVGE